MPPTEHENQEVNEIIEEDDEPTHDNAGAGSDNKDNSVDENCEATTNNEVIDENSEVVENMETKRTYMNRQ